MTKQFVMKITAPDAPAFDLNVVAGVLHGEGQISPMDAAAALLNSFSENWGSEGARLEAGLNEEPPPVLGLIRIGFPDTPVWGVQWNAEQQKFEAFCRDELGDVPGLSADQGAREFLEALAAMASASPQALEWARGRSAA